jgi:thiamine-phosphate diphosphorylase / hydroxyethylthiazole kinase
VAEKQDKLLATLAGLLVFEIAAEFAASAPDTEGPGSFVPRFIDSLRHISNLCVTNDETWLNFAKVEEVVLNSPELGNTRSNSIY